MTPERLADMRTIVQLSCAILNHEDATQEQRLRAVNALATAMREIRGLFVHQWTEPVRMPRLS